MRIKKEPKVVAVGGGTGLSTMLRGLKKYTQNITAVVTVADDGGGSGMLRQDLGILPPGDIRNCIVALAKTEPLMTKLLQYRFEEGTLAGQCFGNLFLAAMCGISKNFEEAVQKVSDVLRVTGRVLPVTTDDVNIVAELENGEKVVGESKIGHALSDKKSKIKTISLIPQDAKPLPDVIEAIGEADIIVLGPGSLYTSIIPNLIVKDVSEAIAKSPAIKMYVCNIMTQPGETNNMTAFDHVSAIFCHGGGRIIDYCIANRQKIPSDLMQKYIDDGAQAVKVSQTRFTLEKIKLVEGNFVSISGGHLRHNYDNLAKTIFDIYINENKKNKRFFSIFDVAHGKFL